MTEANAELARRGFEAASDGDFVAIGELLDSDVKWHGGDRSAAGACQDRGQALAFMRRAYEHGRLGELVDVVGSGDKVVVIMRPPPQGGKQASLVAKLTTFSDGKVIEMVHYANPDDALAVAGARS
jgi:ketosteroid isomerase-like protein